MKVDFFKYTMFKSKITTAGEEGLLKEEKIWFQLAKDGGYLTRSLIEEEEPEKPNNMVVDPEAFKSLVDGLEPPNVM